MRGRSTNEVVDTARVDGFLYARVASTDAEGVTRHFQVRRDGDRIYQRVGRGEESLFVDCGVAPGGSFRAGSGPAEATVTFTSAHDTLTVLGTRFRDVRVYRNVGAGGTYDTPRGLRCRFREPGIDHRCRTGRDRSGAGLFHHNRRYGCGD